MPNVYEDLIVAHEGAGNLPAALEWTDQASKTFGGAPRWMPHKIRLLRKTGRVAEANTATDCSLNATDWKRLCQEANATPAAGGALPARQPVEVEHHAAWSLAGRPRAAGRPQS